MADNLTLRLQEELAKRGKVVSSSDIEKILKKNNISSQPSQTAQPTQPQIPQQPNQDMWSQLGSGQFPDWYEQDNKKNTDNSALNALAVGTWSLLDAAAFGIPGAFVEEEEYIDFEDPLAKWTGAIGSFAGYVKGAPLRVGVGLAKRLASAATPIVTKGKKEGLSTVLKGMRQVGKDGGLSRKSIKEATKSYETLVQKAQVDPNLQKEGFSKAVKNLSEQYVSNGVLRGEITEQQGAAILRMFEGQALKRPLQDFQGLAIAKYGATNPKLAKFLGNAINDVTAFAFIDAVMEGFTTIEDHHYDWTQPLWGAANGIAFSTLSILNPKGKASKWTSDFKIGVKAAFSQKSPYSKMNKEELSRSVKYISESLHKNGYAGEGGLKTINHLGKEIQLMPSSTSNELASDFVEKQWTNAFKGNTEKAMRSFLESNRKKFGREIIKWATKQEAANIMEVWPRMLMGGVLFNTHAFYDMYANDQDYDFSTDILPNLLIGAYIQRHNNPAKFDINSTNMNILRRNLKTLGFHPEQLTDIPSLRENTSDLRNPMHMEKNKPIVDLAREKNIITEDNQVIINEQLGPDEVSVKQETLTGTADPALAEFQKIYEMLVQKGQFAKELDNISLKDAKEIVKEFKKINPEVDLLDMRSFEKYQDEQSMKMTEGFEDDFVNIIDSLKGIEDLKITTDTNNNVLRVPQTIVLDNEILKQAKEGKIEWLKDKDPNTLLESIDSYNSIVLSAESISKIKFDKTNSFSTLTNLDDVKKIYDKITEAESHIQSLFKNNVGHVDKFTFARNFEDFNFVIMKNHAIRYSKNVSDIFKPDFQKDNKDKLISRLIESGILKIDPGTSEIKIVKSINQINFKKTDQSDDVKDAERKRFLGRIHSLQYLLGNYKYTKDILNIDGEKVDVLRKQLSDFGYDESNVPAWVHKSIMNYAVLDKIRDTNLEARDIDTIMELNNFGFSEMGLNIDGKQVTGFSIDFIDEGMFGKAGVAKQEAVIILKNDIINFNNKVRSLIEKSNGLVKPGETKIMTDPVILRELINSFPNEINTPDSIQSSRSLVSEFLNLVGSSDYPKSNKFRDQLGRFVEENGAKGAQRVARWLQGFKIITPNPKTAGFDLNMKNYNEEIVKKELQDKMNTYGFDSVYTDRYFKIMERNARDRASIDSGEGEYLKNISIQDFFKKYRIDNIDNSNSSMEQLNEIMDSILFDNLLEERKKRGLLSQDSINKLIKRLYVPKVHNKDEYTPYKTLTNKRKKQISSDVVKDIIQLFASRRHQKENKVVSFKYGNISTDTEIQQYTRMDAFFDKLDLEYMNLDPFIIEYESSDDGTRIERKQYDLFGDSTNLPEYIRQKIQQKRNKFEQQISALQTLEGTSIKGDNGDYGLTAIRLTPNLNPIIIKTKDLGKIKNEFNKFAKLYGKEDSGVDYKVRNRINEINKELNTNFDKNTIGVPVDYEAALRRLFVEDYLVGSDGDSKFVNFLNNNENISKLLGRVKLYNTKNFIRYNKDFILDASDIYNSIGRKNTSTVLKDRLKKNRWGVAIWDDGGQANLKQQVDEYIEEKGIDWSWENHLGDAHLDVSSYDSQSYVSKETMHFLHAMLGHNPDSYNAIKPVITSGGKESPLLLGKTLFIYSKDLDDFFVKNKNVDILLTKTGAKAYNENLNKDGIDSSILNITDKDLNKTKVESNQIRNISLESIGLKQEKETIVSTGKKSHADSNYMDQEELNNYYNDNIATPLEHNIKQSRAQLENEITKRRFILDTFGDDALTSQIDGTESLNHLSNIAFFSSLTDYANPMSYSPNIVKNKIYSKYFNNILNNKRSVLNQFEPGESPNYGGQASLIQAPILDLQQNPIRLKPTLIKKEQDKVNILSRGEILLTHSDREKNISDLINKGLVIKVVEDNKVHRVETIIDELGDDNWTFKDYVQSNITLGDLHDLINTIGLENNRPDLQIGVIVRRNPRTRPNDMAIMGLKGFLDKTYGNSIMVNSFDVVNIFEGDYDADKADYFFAENENMFNHLERTSQTFVQGVDPQKFTKKFNFNWGMTSGNEHDAIENLAASNELYTKSIGLVQKVPRMLNYIDGLGSKVSAEDKQMSDHQQSKVLYEGFSGARGEVKYKIVIDYDNTDFYQRSAIETQGIIDGEGELNNNIAEHIYTWRDEFLFPTREKSIIPSEIKDNGGIGFIKSIERNGKSIDNKRVRIFRRLELNESTGRYEERTDLSTLDKAILKEMVSEYGNLLSVTGDSVYENSGESKTTSFEERMAAIERFSKFNTDLSNSLYYRLRNRYINYKKDRTGRLINKSKWKNDLEFQSLFNISDPIPYKGKNDKGENRKGTYRVSNSLMFNPTVKQNAESYGNGSRGSAVERALYQIYDANLFGDTKDESLTGESRKILDNWYNEMISDPDKPLSDIKKDGDNLTNNLKREVGRINKHINTIKSLKKIINKIRFNKNLRMDKKQASIQKLNESIKAQEELVRKWLTKEYGFSKKSQDLKNINFVDVNTRGLKEGTIYYSTMDAIEKTLPFNIDNFGLTDKNGGKQFLNDIKAYRRLFYSNNDRLGEVLKYGTKTHLTAEQKRFLQSKPDQTTHYELETELLARGVERYGLKFIWAFMKPALNKYNIGIHNGNPVAVPFEATETYDPSSRYRRGISFLTEYAKGSQKLRDLGVDPLMQSFAKSSLAYLQLTETKFRRFFDNRFDINSLISKNIGDSFMYGFDKAIKASYESIRLPDFHNDLQRNLYDFGSINWNKTGERIKSGFGLMNDHLLDFYREIMVVSGKDKEFDNYLNSMNELQNISMSNKIMNPIEYMHIRNQIDSDVKRVAKMVLTSGLKDGNEKPEIVKKLMDNPVFALMGGSSYMKGLSLEKQSNFNLKTLSDIHKMSNRIEKVKDDLPFTSSASQERFERSLADLEGIKTKCL